MLPEERARLYRRRDGAARRTSRPRNNYCYTREFRGFARVAEGRDRDIVTTSLTLNGFQLWGIKFRIELAGDTERQVRDDGHSIGVNVADGRLDFLRFSLFGRYPSSSSRRALTCCIT